MRILFTRFPLASVYGGAEVQTLSLMKGLRERGHEVMFLGSCSVLLKKTEELRIKNYELRIGIPPVTKWGAMSFLWRQKEMRQKLTEQLAAFRLPPSAIFMLSLSEKLLLTDWAVARGIRVFWIEHDRVGRWLRWNPWLPRLRRLSRLATTVAVSGLSKRIYTGLGWDPERIVVIPNGIDTEKFGVMVSPSNHDAWQCAAFRQAQCDTLHMGTIARLSPEKGIDLLIEAIKDLPNIHLTIVGAGRDEYHLRQLAQRITNNEQRVTIVSSVPDVAAFYRSLDIFVLPSRDHDPCPLAPMEAMVCGVPVIMTDACGTAEYVENGKEAIVVLAGSVEALRAAIIEAANGERRATLSRGGWEAAQKKFSLERMVGEYERAFHFFPSRPSQRERGRERGL